MFLIKNMQHEFDLTTENLTATRFKFFILLFRISGIPMFDKVPKLFKIYSVVVTFFAYMFFITIFLEVFEHTEDLGQTIDAIQIATACAMSIWLYSFLRFRSSQVMKLMRLTDSFSWETLPNRDEETGVLTMTGWIIVVKSIVRKFLICSFIHITIYTIEGLLLSDEKSLMYNAWVPYDATASPGHELTLLMQMSGSVTYVCAVFSFVGLYATLVCIACSEIQKLKIILRKTKDVSTALHEESNMNAEQMERNFLRVCREMHENIITCVQHHQKFLSFIRAMEDALNPVMAGMFLISLMTLCLSSFSVATSMGNYPQMAMGSVLYVFTLTVLAIWCWFGYELSSQAESVRDAAWGCDWIGKPIALQQNISLIIEMTNMEITLTAGKFVPITISTLVNMINQSMSYFMFLLEVKTSFETTESPTTD